MEEVILALMHRDGITRTEAKQRIRETLDEVYAALEAGDSDEAETIWTDNLGLEVDYLMRFFGA